MIELRTLGSLALLRPGEEPSRAIPLQAKRLALLAYLAAAPRSTFRRRDTVLALFWPELDQEHARGALRQALHSLRRALGAGALITRGEDEVGLDPAVVTSDAARLEAAVERGDAHEAQALYRGEFLEGVFVADTGGELEDWVAAERSRLRTLAARAAWMASEQPAGDADVGELVRRAVLLSGDDESALRRGIARLEERGDRVGAAALYEEFSRRVARDLDVELSSETQAAMRAVRARHGPAAPGVGAAEAPAPDAGSSGEAGQQQPDVQPRGKPIILAAAAGAVLTLALAAYLGSTRSPAPPPSPDLLAVMPFRVVGSDTSLAWLGDGIVELLTIRIARDGGPALADPALVLAEWRRTQGRREGVSPDAGRTVAARIGAGRFIEGSLATLSGRVTLTATLSSLDEGGAAARASVEGPADRVPALVDQMAVQLLGLSAGVQQARLASLTSASLPAIQAYLRGQEAFRSGRMSLAVESFREATTLDSTFALAGLRLTRASMWAGTSVEGARGFQLAMANRDRLGPADRVFLDAMATPDEGSATLFAAWNAAVVALPQSAELWYTLGDHHYHWGRLAGEPDAAERASVAFRRGWRLDSLAGPATGRAWAPEPAEHMLALAHMAADTAAVLQLAAAIVRADSTSDLAYQARWHQAALSGPAARRAYRDDITSVSDVVIKNIHLFIVWTGLETEDLAWLIPEDMKRLRAHDPGWKLLTLTYTALNAGRPSEAPRVNRAAGYAGHRALRDQLRRAMWWGADTTRALSAAALLQPFADSAPVQGAALRAQLSDVCALGLWRGARGDSRYAELASRRLRGARPDGLAAADSGTSSRAAALCAALLSAMVASEARAPDARARVAEADSLASDYIFEVCCGPDAVTDANLQLMRLWEREGDNARALAAIRRGAGPFGIMPLYVSTFLREEGRLALLVADTAGAVRAYRHYLALRPDPEAGVRPEVDRVRRELMALGAR